MFQPTLREITERLGVRLLRSEHDPLALARTSSDLLIWDGSQLQGLTWVDVDPPEGGDTVSMGWRGMRHLEYGEVPTHVQVPLTLWGDYCGDTMQRANFEALQQDYPDTFIQVGWAERDGISLVVDLSKPLDEHLLAGLVRMRDDYPVWSDEKMSEVEMNLADEAWDGYLRMDLPGDLRDQGIDEDVVDELDLDADGPGSLREAFYEITGNQPEYPRGEAHCGTSVIFPYYKETVTELALRLEQVTDITLMVRFQLSEANPWLRLPGLAVPALRR